MLFLVSCSKRIVHRFLIVSQIKRLGGLLGGRETMTVLYTNLTQCHKTVQCFDVVVIWDSTGWKPVLRRVSCFSKCIIVKDFLPVDRSSLWRRPHRCQSSTQERCGRVSTTSLQPAPGTHWSLEHIRWNNNPCLQQICLKKCKRLFTQTRLPKV